MVVMLGVEVLSFYHGLLCQMYYFVLEFFYLFMGFDLTVKVVI